MDAPTLVQASAGTGKTYAITTYFVRAILERDLTPEQILVVTYTKAATAELRLRTRARILKAITLIDAPSDGADVLEEVVAEAVRRMGRRETLAGLRAALGQMDRAAILTIHGFCQRLLQDYPLLFGIDVDFEVTEDSSSIYSELAVDYWTTELYDAPAWLLRALEHENVNAAQLASLAKAAMMPGIEVLGPAPNEVDQALLEQWSGFKLEAAGLWRAGRADVAKILTSDKALDGRSYRAQTIEHKWLPGLDDFFSKAGFGFPPDFFPRLAQGNMKTKNGREEPHHPFFGACARLWQVHEMLVPGLEYAVFSFRERFIEFAREQCKRRREEQAVLTFDDLLRTVYAPFDSSRADRASFDPARIAETISTAYPLALIDEFQDTDNVQYGIFRAIYGESSAIYVGDPKQAIYAFRGADVFSYIGAVKDVGNRVYTLSTNRRSDPGLVRAVNALFSLRTPPFILDSIEMQEATPHYEESRSTFDPSMEIVFLDKEQVAGPIAPAVAPIVANEIALLLDSEAEVEGRPVEPGDIAVLCRSNNQALAVTEALRALNVPVSLDGGSSVLSTDIAADLSAVLEAALMPGDSSLVRRALLTPLLGVSPYELATMTDEVWSDWASRLREWHDTWHSQGVVRFLEDMLRGTGAEAALARRPAPRRTLTDLLHIEEVLLRGERERRRNPVALMQWFRRLNEAKVSDRTVAPEDLQRRPDAEAGAVRVSTVHKSKGLEYPIVYCPFNWGWKHGELAVKFHDDRGNLKVDLGSACREAHQERSEREASSEALRLLYVAVTRAKYRCTIFWGRAAGWKSSALGYLLHGLQGLDALDEDGMREDVARFAVASQGLVGWRPAHEERARPRTRHTLTQALAARTKTRYFSQAARIASFTSLTGHDEKTPGRHAPKDSNGPQTPLFAELPGGVRTGLLLHAILEEADFQELDAGKTEQLIERQLRGFGFDPVLAPAIQRDLQSVGTTPFTRDPDAPSLIDLDSEVQLRELEFMLHASCPRLEDLAELLKHYGAPEAAPHYYERLVEVGGQTLQRFLRGYIDLMFEWKGRWYVADYKSNILPAYQPEAVTEAVQRTHYLLQAQLYTAAAQRHLKQRVPGYDAKTQWGGALFLFLRGMRGPGHAGSSIFFDRQTAELLNAVDRWLGGTDAPL